MKEMKQYNQYLKLWSKAESQGLDGVAEDMLYAACMSWLQDEIYKEDIADIDEGPS